MITLPARIGCAKLRPAHAAINSQQPQAVCFQCFAQFAESKMLAVYPDSWITKWCCACCERKEALQALVRQGQRIAGFRSRYLERNGYAMVAGTKIFAANPKLSKVVAFVNGKFTRDEMKSIMREARELDLPSTRLTVLVNGLAVYHGGSMQVIRIDENHQAEDTANGLLADLMSDVRAAKLAKQ